jgi:hypothetical protein
VTTGVGAILTSPDGITWTPRTSGTPNGLRSIVWNGSQFVVVGGNPGVSGTILTSPDGINWTTPIVTSNFLVNITWDGSQFVAVGFAGTILTSPDGINWTPQFTGTANNLTGINWNGSLFVAVGQDGITLISADGVSWTSQSTGTSSGLRQIARNGSRYVVVGTGGTILVSGIELHGIMAGTLICDNGLGTGTKEKFKDNVTVTLDLSAFPLVTAFIQLEILDESIDMTGMALLKGKKSGLLQLFGDDGGDKELALSGNIKLNKKIQEWKSIKGKFQFQDNGDPACTLAGKFKAK